MFAVMDPARTADPAGAWKEYWRCHLRLNQYRHLRGTGTYRNAVEALVDPSLVEAGEEADNLIGLISEGIGGNGREFGRLFLDNDELVHEVRLPS